MSQTSKTAPTRLNTRNVSKPAEEKTEGEVQPGIAAEEAIARMEVAEARLAEAQAKVLVLEMRAKERAAEDATRRAQRLEEEQKQLQDIQLDREGLDEVLMEVDSDKRMELIKVAKKTFGLPELEYSEIGQGKNLEAWLFKWDMFALQSGLNKLTHDTAHLIVMALMDAPLNVWMQNKLDQRLAESKLGFTMTWLKDQLKREFVSKIDEDQAMDEVFKLKLGHTEDMESFTQRATALFQRITDERLPAHTKAELLFKAVKNEDSCYPTLVSRINSEQNQLRKDKKIGMNLVQMRERLVILAKEEPRNEKLEARKRSIADHSGQGSSTTSKSILKNSFAKKARFSANLPGPQINALNHEEEEEVAPENMMEKLYHMVTAVAKKQAAQDQMLAAIKNTTPRTGACTNCGKAGHWWKECPEPKRPYCSICRKVGHTRQDCTTKTNQGDDKTEGLKGQNRGGQ